MNLKSTKLCERSQTLKALISLILHSIKDKAIKIEKKMISGFQGSNVGIRINHGGHEGILWVLVLFCMFILVVLTQL